jgi:hypothetical protein
MSHACIPWRWDRGSEKPLVFVTGLVYRGEGGRGRERKRGRASQGDRGSHWQTSSSAIGAHYAGQDEYEYERW